MCGCHRGGPGASQQKATRPPAAVDVVASVTQRVIDYREFTGRTAAVNSVEVRTRVSGYLLQSPQYQDSRTNRNAMSNRSQRSRQTELAESIVKKQARSFAKLIVMGEQSSEDVLASPVIRDSFEIKVREGERVERGTPLFEVDPAPYQLILNQAEGNLAATQAQLKRFRLDLQRADELVSSNSISKAEYDLAVANEAEALGQIENLKASVNRARLDLSFTQVTSPIDGLLGRTLVTNGNLVVADTTILTTIVSTDPIQVYFDVDENSVLDYRARVRSGDVQSARDTSISVDLGLANDSDFPYRGIIDFVDNTTDPATGNTRMRGRFENSSGALSPGLFARIRAPFSQMYDGVLVPTTALAMDQQGRFVIVVDGKNIAHRRAIEVGSSHGNMTVIKKGIERDERVAVSGLQKIRDGDPVDPKDVSSKYVQENNDIAP